MGNGKDGCAPCDVISGCHLFKILQQKHTGILKAFYTLCGFLLHLTEAERPRFLQVSVPVDVRVSEWCEEGE